jgi:hypothetical protein
MLGLPYGDQGLLISRKLYDEVGGFLDVPLMEDVMIVRAIGKQRLTELNAEARTSAAKYERDGWGKRSWRNAFLLIRFLLGAKPEDLAKTIHLTRSPLMREDRNSMELYRQEGENFRSVRATLEDGQIHLRHTDMGKLVEEMWGDSDYEFWDHRPEGSLGPVADGPVESSSSQTTRRRQTAARHLHRAWYST